MEDEEIILEEKNINKEKSTQTDNECKAIIKSMFCDYLSVGLSIIALIITFLSSFFVVCGVSSLGLWLSLIVTALVVSALIIECIKFIREKKLDFKGSLVLVFAIALILI